MIYLNLLLAFLKVGCFSFGGAYGAIPLIRDVVLAYGFLTEEQLSYMIAVSESTPGPIMVNLATFVGSSQAGLWGAVLATAAVVLPSFAVILILTAALTAAIRNRYVQAALGGVKPCITGIVLATGICMVLKNLIPAGGAAADIRSIIITAVLAALMPLTKRFFKKMISPIQLILTAAALGAVLYGIG